MRKVLIIAYYFPPLGGIGAIWPVQFAKYLPEFGWEPVILTVDHGQSFVRDQSLVSALPAGTKIYRARSWELFNATQAKKAVNRLEPEARQNRVLAKIRSLLKSLYFAFYIPDDKIGWLPWATKLGRQLIEQEGIDLVFATAPPNTNFLVGKMLKRHSNKPLVVDYRDEWTTIRYVEIVLNPLTRFINRYLERSILNEADGVITVMQHIEDDLRQAQLLPATTPATLIPNGFDPDEYQTPRQPAKERLKFSIIYTGSIYGDTRRPDNFLQALKYLFQDHPPLRAKIQVFFVGSMSAEQLKLIDDLALADVVQVKGFVPHHQAVEYQLSADALLLIVNHTPGSKVWLMGKIFEYLGAGRPILALVPTDGAAADLINRSRTGLAVDPDNIKGISQTIHQLYLNWVADRVDYQPDLTIVNQYNRRTLTQKLAHVFDDVIREHMS